MTSRPLFHFRPLAALAFILGLASFACTASAADVPVAPVPPAAQPASSSTLPVHCRLCGSTTGMPPLPPLIKWENAKIDQWYGYTRYQLIIDGCQAWVAEPKNPLTGNPWAWSMKFADRFTVQTGALKLLERGFYFVFIDIGNNYGSPNSLKHLDAFYAAITQKGLARKGTLVAMSRGGLDAYGWARDNTDKVICIYGDAPVCDFKSWPGGKGKSKGSPKDWAKLPEAYGFKDEAEALAWSKNPIDTLVPLAQAKIPLIHVVGDVDTVVPVAENTAILEQRYRALGGEITVIHKPEVDHHPHGLDDPTPVVDFIQQQTERALKQNWGEFRR